MKEINRALNATDRVLINSPHKQKCNSIGKFSVLNRSVTHEIVWYRQIVSARAILWCNSLKTDQTNIRNTWSQTNFRNADSAIHPDFLFRSFIINNQETIGLSIRPCVTEKTRQTEWWIMWDLEHFTIWQNSLFTTICKIILNFNKWYYEGISRL